MDRRIWTGAAAGATIALAGALAGCANGPYRPDTNGVSTGGASGQVLVSPNDTIQDSAAGGAAAPAPRDTTRRRP